MLTLRKNGPNALKNPAFGRKWDQLPTAARIGRTRSVGWNGPVIAIDDGRICLARGMDLPRRRRPAPMLGYGRRSGSGPICARIPVLFLLAHVRFCRRPR